MNNAKEIIARIKELKSLPTNTAVAQYLGVSYNTLNTWLKRKKIPDSIIKKVVQDEQISYDWLLENKKDAHNEDKNTVHIPMLELNAGAGEGVYNYEPQQTLISLNTTLFPAINQKSVAIQIVGDSMEPELLDGDYIIITSIEPGRISEDGVYAIRIDGMVKVKALQFKLDGTVKIISYNKNYETEVYDPKTSQLDFEILGRKELRITRR